MTAGDAGVAAGFGFGDSAGVDGEVAVAEADAGKGVDDAPGTGEEEAGGAPTLVGCAGGLTTGAWAKAVVVRKLRAVRTRKTLFISNVTLIRIAAPSLRAESEALLISSRRIGANCSGGDQNNKAAFRWMNPCNLIEN